MHWPRRPLYSLVGAVAAEDMVVEEDMVAAVVSTVAVAASMEASPALVFGAVALTSQAEVLEAADLAEDIAEASAVVMAVMAAMATTDTEQILPAG